MKKLVKLILLSIILFVYSFVVQAFHKDFASNIVGPSIINNNENLGEFIYQPWPQSYLSKDVWWVPLELSDNNKDVIEAIIIPGYINYLHNIEKNINYIRGYKIEIGNRRQTLDDNNINIAKAVGRLMYSPKFGRQWTCTATHVGNNLVVTAGHCVADPKFIQDACSSLSFEWDFRRSRDDFTKIPEPVIVGKCTEIISWEFSSYNPSTLDHAIIKVDNAPIAMVEIDKQPDLKEGNKLQQFSHPGGAPLIWATSCEVTSLPIQYYQHNCWGASGSSGSALIDAQTNKLVGILSMGSDEKNFSLRNDMSPIGCLDINTGRVDPVCNR